MLAILRQMQSKLKPDVEVPSSAPVTTVVASDADKRADQGVAQSDAAPATSDVVHCDLLPKN